MITASETQYIFPPRPEGSTPRKDTEIYADLDWIAQFKYNDTRCLIKLCSDGRIQLWNRHAEQMRTYSPPIWLQHQLEHLTTREDLGIQGYCLFDGGLLHQKHKAIKDTIVIWDILVINGEHLVGTTYQHRYNKIHALCNGESYKYKGHHLSKNHRLGTKITDDIFVPDLLTPSEWTTAWDTVDEVNYPFLSTNSAGPLLEGLVFKDPDGELEFGFKQKNNSSWQSRSRVSTGRHAF